MKPEIHPKYTKVTANCANCGNAFETRSTRHSIKVDICSNCHPYYTGKQVLVDTAGRVERFNKRFAKSSAAQAKNN
jgi:large subunit ribosomal protein L31